MLLLWFDIDPFSWSGFWPSLRSFTKEKSLRNLEKNRKFLNFRDFSQLRTKKFNIKFMYIIIYVNLIISSKRFANKLLKKFFDTFCARGLGPSNFRSVFNFNEDGFGGAGTRVTWLQTIPHEPLTQELASSTLSSLRTTHVMTNSSRENQLFFQRQN